MTNIQHDDDRIPEMIAKIDEFRETLRAAIVEVMGESEGSVYQAKSHAALTRIAETLDDVPDVTLFNIATLNEASRGSIMSLVKIHLLASGLGPTLDHENAVAFLAEFQPVIDRVRRPRLN
jgi:hypothetical protein